MKTKLLILFLFTANLIYSQKEIYPYTWTKQKGDKTSTIIIHAAPSSVNNVIFSLKNNKNEPLLLAGVEIKFTVFPFEEIFFREKLIEKLKALNEESKILKNDNPDGKKELWEIMTYDKRETYVHEIRNVYKYFESLINTAYEYDTEPLAGTLNYNMKPTVIKKNAGIIDTDIYFKKLAEIVFTSFKNNKNVLLEISEDLEKNTDVYLSNDVCKDSFLLKKMISYNENILNNNRSFKKYIEEQLVKDYNRQLIIKFIKEPHFSCYRSEKNKFSEKKKEIEKLNRTILDENVDILNQKEVLNALEELTETIIYLISSLEDEWSSDYSQDHYDVIYDYFYLPDTLISKLADEKLTKFNFEYKKLNHRGYANLKKDEFKVYNKNLKDSINQYKKEVKNKINLNNKDLENNKLKNDTAIKDLDSLNNNINKHIRSLYNKTLDFPVWKFNVNENNGFQIEFNDGFIENIIVLGHVVQPYFDVRIINDIEKLKPSSFTSIQEVDFWLNSFFNEKLILDFIKSNESVIKFENAFPIGYSSRKNYSAIYNYNLHNYRGKQKFYSVKLSDLITLYTQHLQNDRLDFSPKDQVVNFPDRDLDQNGSLELKKEKTSKILSGRIFSDFNGFDKKNPNGLVQFEINKFIPLLTNRYPFLNSKKGENFGILNYVNPLLAFTKIENDNRERQVKYKENYVNNIYQPKKFITYLDVFEYESISVGFDANIFTFDLPNSKLRYEINFGIYFGRVNVIDTISKRNNLPIDNGFLKKSSTTKLNPEIILRIRPEERFGGYISYKFIRMRVPNETNFFVVANEKEFITNGKLSKQWLQQFKFSVHYSPSNKNDNKYFFRYRYTNNLAMETNGYSEFQVGALFYLKF